MQIKFINKNGNIEELEVGGNVHRASDFENIDGVYFEKKDELPVEELIENIDYKNILKDNGVKSTHLLGDEKAKQRCIELGLI